MQGCPFGLGSVVLQFNRYPALVVAAARRILGLGMAAYFDDNILAEPHASSPGARDCLLQLFDLLGTPPKRSKTLDMSAHRVFLGASVTHMIDKNESKVIIAPRESTRAQVLSDLGAAIVARSLTSAHAAKVRGRTGWLACNSFGRIGRIGSAVLKRLQYSRRSGPHLTHEEVQALSFHRAVVAQVPPRLIRTGPAGARRPMILYSDAEYTEGSPPRVGFVLFRDPPAKPVGVSFLLPPVVTRKWLQRRQHIFPAEAIALQIALAIFAPFVQGRDVVAFCDNSAAVSTLIQGASKAEDTLAIAELFTAVCIDIGARCWVDWVDSQSNPADGLSRAGVHDSWTMAQGWVIREVAGTKFPDLAPDPFLGAVQLRHWAEVHR